MSSTMKSMLGIYTNNTTDTSYPLLKSLKIPTTCSFDSPLDAIKISNVLREVTMLHKDNDREMTFHWANGRQAYMTIIERIKNRQYLTKKNRDWFMDILSHMNPTDVGEAAACLCSWLLNKFQDQYEDVGKKAGLVRLKKLNGVQLTAALDEANMTHNAGNIFLRHIHHHTGFRLAEPLKKMVELGDYPYAIKFGKAKIEKEKGKKEEKVKYWTMCLCEALKENLQRLLNNSEEDITKLTKFGYERNGEKTVDVIAGHDHGDDAYRGVARINLLSSAERRKSGRIDTGSCQITFAKTECKKDTYEITNLTAAEIRDAFKKIKESMFLAVKDDEGVVSIKIVKKRHHFDTDRCWVLIPGFTLFICGDLAYYAIAMGRDGSAGCRCPYCHLSLREFGDKDKEGIPLTLDKLNKAAIAYHDPDDDTDTLGVKHPPQLQEENFRYISPVLHCEIGTVDKVLMNMLYFIDLYVQHLPNVEIGRRKKLKELEEKLDELKKKVDEVATAKKEFTKKRVAAKKIIKRKETLVRAVKKKLRKTNLSPEIRLKHTDTIRDLEKEISQQQVIFKENKDLAAYAVIEYNEREELRLATSKEVTKLRKMCNQMKKDRKGDKDGMEALIEDILRQIAQIRPEAYHGGTLNGMSCQKLLANAGQIMKRISDLCSEMWVKRNIEGYAMIPQEELTKRMDLYKELFGVLDVVFSLLRQPAPTEDEILRLEKMTAVLERLWRQADMSITVKAHILFKHAIDQVKAFGGIADKVEDFVEKAHQEGKKYNDITKRMGPNWIKKQQTQISRQWAAQHPAVLETKKRVTEASRRNKRKASAVDNVTTKKRQAKLDRREATCAYYSTHFVTHLTSHL